MKTKIKQKAIISTESYIQNSNTLPEGTFTRKKTILEPLETLSSPRNKSIGNQFSTNNFNQLKTTKAAKQVGNQQIKKQFFFHSPQNSQGINQHIFPPLSRQRKNASIGGDKEVFQSQEILKSPKPKLDHFSPINSQQQQQQLAQFKYLSQRQTPIVTPPNETQRLSQIEPNSANQSKINFQAKQQQLEQAQKQLHVSQISPRSNFKPLQQMQMKLNTQVKQQHQQSQGQVQQTKFSHRQFGVVFGYGANTHQGIVRNYNEDRVTIVINANKPQEKISAE